MDKKILTWTTLCDMVKHISKSRPDDYQELVIGGTDRLIPGHYVRLSYDRVFTIHRGPDKSSPALVEVHGIRSEAGYFTKIKHELTPTSYRKRFWDRYMPVSFPDGLPLRGHNAKCVFHSTDGHTQEGSVKLRAYRGEPARFSANCESNNYLMVNDTTGKVVHIGPKQYANPEPGSAVEVYLWDMDDERAGNHSFPYYRFATVFDTCNGIPQGAVTSRDEWLKSIWRACEVGLMDKYQCLPLAARMWNAGYRFCQDNKDKQPRMIAYPIEALAHGKRQSYGCRAVLAYSNPRITVVNGEQEPVPINSHDACFYRLPQLDIRWEGERESGYTRHNPAVMGSTMTDPRFINMVLPPHGNPLLYQKPHYAAPHCRTAHAQSRMNGENIPSPNGNGISVLSEDRLVVQFLERAYHGIRAIDPSKLGDMGPVYSRNRMYNANVSCEEAGDEQPYAKWEDFKDCVLVQSNFDEAVRGQDGPWAEHTQESFGMPATPESAIRMVEEAALIDSLPLS